MSTRENKVFRCGFLRVIVPAIVVQYGLIACSVGLAQEAKQPDPYVKAWAGWENRPLEKARKEGSLIFQSDFSPAGIARDWKASGVVVESREGAAVLFLSPERIAANKKSGALWAKAPFAQPMMIEIEFTLDPSCPHDANMFWGQKMPSDENLGKKQECFVAGYFGWGGRSCGYERASDWHVYGITAAAEPKPGTKQTGVWIIREKLQCLYLDGTLLLYSMTPAPPPESGYFGLAIYQSTVCFHSAKIYRLGPKKR